MEPVHLEHLGTPRNRSELMSSLRRLQWPRRMLPRQPPAACRPAPLRPCAMWMCQLPCQTAFETKSFTDVQRMFCFWNTLWKSTCGAKMCQKMCKTVKVSVMYCLPSAILRVPFGLRVRKRPCIPFYFNAFV